MKLVVFVTMVLLSIMGARGQQSQGWDQMLKDPDFAGEKFKSQNRVDHYVTHDFSTLFTPRTQFLGFIGDDFQRLKIYYTSISRIPKDPRAYRVDGISIVKSNRITFSGEIRINRVLEYKQHRLGLDDRMKDIGHKAQGVLFASYKFAEDRKQPNSGVFEGSMVFSWYLDIDGVMQYDDIEFHSDSFRNNQYLGTWTQYGSSIRKVANWGEYRIPFSGDLDIGAGEFSPNPKYLEKGWRDRELY
ncbi:MAG TPA: hypothetical protein PKD24_11960 [Pyrinomonadaceae bacterium]|nr:hypothetical protein [Pyrinomonadaceae bacterium]HMP65963.1 hypothetical protein [Pyrinomonadaceae bacterium]